MATKKQAAPGAAPGLAIDGLKQGQKYRVVYKLNRSVKEMVGSYMGLGTGGLQFNMRPLAGTAVVPAGAIVEMWETSAKKRLPARSMSSLGEVRVF